MDTKFVNQYAVTYEIYREWSRHPVGKTALRNRRRELRIRITLALCGFIMFGIGVSMRDIFNIVFGITFVIMALLRLFVLPDKVLRKQYNLVVKMHKSAPWTRRISFGDTIICKDENASYEYSYSDIIKMTEDQDYFYLFYDDDLVLRIRKGCFIIGSDDTFREYCYSYILKKDN